MRKPLLAGAGLIALGAMCSASFAADGPAMSIHYFKELRPLTLDPARVAVLVASAGGARAAGALDGEIASALAGAGLDSAHAEASAVAGWWLAPIDEARRAGRSNLEIVRDGAAATERLVNRTGARIPCISPVFVDDLGGPMFPTPEILVQFAPGTTRATVETILAETGAGVVIEADWDGIAGSYRIDPGARNGADVLAAANMLAVHGAVEYAEPDMVFTGRGDLIPNDPSFANCWGLNNTGQFGGAVVDMDMNAPQAWDTTLGSASILTVIIDSGVQQDHPDINQIPGFDTTTDSGDGGPVNSFDNHGTAVGGCVSAIANNALGTVGSAPGTRVVSARTFITTSASGSWSSSAAWTVNSLNFAATLGARVSNNSNYYGFTSSAIASAYNQTRASGMVHFASAGNDNLGTVTYPSSLPAVMAIGALNLNGAKASFSNFGPQLDFMAPGQSVYSTDRTGSAGYYAANYGYVDGTSFASPYAAGVAALVLSRCDALTAPEVEAQLLASCKDLGAVGRDDTFGQGLIRADQAISGVGRLPCAFVLVAPGASATGVSPSAPFDWTDAAWAVSYSLEVRDGTGGLVIDVPVIAGSTYTPPPGALRYGRAYQWTVTAANVQGEIAGAPIASPFTTAPSPCIGDVDGNGRTNIADFNILASSFGQAVAPGTGADLAEDGIVNVSDFNVLASDFGCGS